MATQTSTNTIVSAPSSRHIRIVGSSDALPIQFNRRQAAGPNPPDWPTNYRRVPPHRPVNRHLDPAERPNGASTGEYVFVNVMLNGVRLNSVSLSKLNEHDFCHQQKLTPCNNLKLFVTSYERTLGKFYPSLTRYRIGSEW